MKIESGDSSKKVENDCPGCGAVVVPSAAMVPSTLGNVAGGLAKFARLKRL